MKHRKIITAFLSTTALAFALPHAAQAGEAAAVAPATAVAPTTAVAASGTALDAAINGQIAAALMADSKLAGARIEVDTKDGVVSLKGKVAADSESKRAIEIASSVKGVQRVDNQLEVMKAK